LRLLPEMNDQEMKRILGAFYGQIIGDALGVTCEFLNAEETKATIADVKENAEVRDSVMPMIGCPKRKIEAGQVRI
jgi:ADP-ribosylglycohydrolase